MLVTTINLTQAARFAAISVEGDSADTTTFVDSTAMQAADQNEGGAGAITCSGSTACASVSYPNGTEFPDQQLAVVTLTESVQPYIPLFPKITVSGTATAQATGSS